MIDGYGLAQAGSVASVLLLLPLDSACACTGKAALARSVQELYGSSNLADISLVVNGRRIPAHRHVLAPHSPVFERMWQHSMSEVCLQK